jgi:hypothetical protein
MLGGRECNHDDNRRAESRDDHEDNEKEFHSALRRRNEPDRIDGALPHDHRPNDGVLRLEDSTDLLGEPPGDVLG